MEHVVTVANFGAAGGKKNRCKTHMSESDVVLRHGAYCVKCVELKRESPTVASYAPPDGERKDATFCLEHKPAHYISTSNTHKCARCNKVTVKKGGDLCLRCTKGMDVEDVHKRAATHKDASRVPLGASDEDVAAAVKDGRAIAHPSGSGYRCHGATEDGLCKTQAFYGITDGPRIFCASHCDKAIHTYRGKLAKCDTCGLIATYKKPFATASTRCASHRTPDMLMARTRCKMCERQATFAPKDAAVGTAPTHCNDHVPAKGYHYVAGPRCATCHIMRVRLAADQCWTCRGGTERIKHMEEDVAAAVTADRALRLNTARDKVIPCRPADAGAFRPEFCWVLSDRVVVLEVDEHQHRYYEASREIARLHQLHEAVAPLPLMVLRYNPHAANHNLYQHACMRLRVRDLLVEDIPDDGLGIHYMGYDADRMTDLTDAGVEMHAAAEAAAIEVEDSEEEEAAAGAGAGARGPTAKRRRITAAVTSEDEDE